MKTNLIVTVLFAIAVTDSGISQNLTSYDINGASPNIAGTDNTALGKNVMSSSASGCLNNTGVGKDCLFSLTTGDNNVGIGKEALYSCTGGYNVAAGVQA